MATAHESPPPSILKDDDESQTSEDDVALLVDSYVPDELPFLPLLDDNKDYEVAPGLLVNGPPFSLEISTAPGLFTSDDIVTGPKRDPVYYYIDFMRHLKKGGWTLKMYRGSKNGPLALTITKPRLSSKFTVTMPNGWHTRFARPKMLSIKLARSFRGFDGKSLYTWAPENGWLSRWTCTNEDGDTIATWRQSPWSPRKHGQLLINSAYREEGELILATTIALEEWQRELRKRQRSTGGGGGA